MIGLTAPPMAVQAGLVLILVFVEALTLYVGYGAIEQRLAGPLLDTIADA